MPNYNPPYTTEHQGQEDFYSYFKQRDNTLPEFENWTDGVIKGTILEFKLQIQNYNKVLRQTQKYLSRMRNSGKDIPAQILLVSLNDSTAYLYNSADFLKEIETPYIGSASVNNDNYTTTIEPQKIKFEKNFRALEEILDKTNTIKVHIDLFDVVGYATRFYNENPTKTKIDFFNEIRNPENSQFFKDKIYAWEGNEDDFKYIMDCLNDKQHKKELGAFYTPKEYIRLSTKMVRDAIKRIKQAQPTHDYIILDRCAGTGNLEQFLTDKNVDDITIKELSHYIGEEEKDKYISSFDPAVVIALSKTKSFDNYTLAELKEYEKGIKIRDLIYDNELSHCIVNTYELKEWIVLNELMGQKVKMIIPPVENVNNKDCLVSGGDALSEYFITANENLFKSGWEVYRDTITELNNLIKNPNINVIMLENPPYRDNTADNTEEKKGKVAKSYVYEELKKEKTDQALHRDLSNLFIWSAQKYYLTKPDDFYINYSPVKYFKSIKLCEKDFIDGYLLNREYFHASPSSISLMMWQNSSLSLSLSRINCQQ